MNKIELLENLMESAKKATFDNRSDFDELVQRTKMIIRKIFGEDTHYLKDLNGIKYYPSIWVSGMTDEDSREDYENGLKQFRNALKTMLEDVKLSSNYDENDTKEKSKFIKSEISKNVKKEIKVLIASPSDVTIARDLLLNQLETKFRREGFEEKCGSRIVVEGWEFLASQSGYTQDLVNEQLLSKVNIVLAIFKHRLGSPTLNLKDNTERAPSGTAEELLYAIRNKKIEHPPLGMAYFSSVAPVISLDSINFDETQKEWNRLKQFREEIKNEILFKPYNVEEEIIEIACKDICNNIINRIK